MKQNLYAMLGRLFALACILLSSVSLRAATEVNVATAGTLSSLLSETENELKVTGFINGSDIKVDGGFSTVL